MKRGNNNILSGKKLRKKLFFCQASVCSSVLFRPQQRFGVKDIKALGGSQLSVLDRPCSSSQGSNGPCYSS